MRESRMAAERSPRYPRRVIGWSALRDLAVIAEHPERVAHLRSPRGHGASALAPALTRDKERRGLDRPGSLVQTRNATTT